MAAVTETTKDMDNDIDSAEQFFMIMPRTSRLVRAIPPADPDNPTLAERLFVRTNFSMERTDGRAGGDREAKWEHVDDSTIATFTAGDASDLRALLLKIYNHQRTGVDL